MADYDVLAIDDEQVVADGIEKILSMEGYKVDKVLSGREALENLEKRTYKLIICDIMLPYMDGFGFMERMRERNIDIPVIMATGYSTVENAVRSLNEGAIDFIPKPFEVDELLAPVTRGMKYGKLLKKLKDGSGQEDTMLFVPCPAKYYRLGYASWAAREHDGTLLIGATDLFMKTIDNIEDFGMHDEETEIIQGNSCVEITDDNQLVHKFLSPVSGRILERNEKIIEDHDILYKDPYFGGWIYRVIPSDIDYEINKLTPCSSDRM